MSPEVDVGACADLLRRGDPDRFAATMAAPVAARRVLFALYAFNVEVARVPWVTHEPMIAQMRLQWWHDVLDEIALGQVVRAHEVSTPLAEILDADGARCLQKLVAARHWDIERAPFRTCAEFWDYLDATSGHLLWTGVRLLEGGAEAIIRDYAKASGLAGFLRGLDRLEDRDQVLPAPIDELARQGLDYLQRACAQHHLISPSARDVMLAGWRARVSLSKAARSNTAHGLEESEFRKRGRLLRLSLLGWWR